MTSDASVATAFPGIAYGGTSGPNPLTLTTEFTQDLLEVADPHDGSVTDILLDMEDQVVTGSTDHSVCVLPLSALRPGSDLPDSSVQRHHYLTSVARPDAGGFPNGR